MNTKNLFFILLCVLFATCSDDSNPVPTDDTPEESVKPGLVGNTYQVPVIFHVLYADKEDEKQYIPASHLTQLLQKVNDYYDGKTLYAGGEKGIDMDVDFLLASHDEKGNKLATLGVEYIQVPDVEISCEEMMQDKSYLKYMWDHNRYINVVLYHFAAVQNGVILGISNMPYSVAGDHELAGLATVSQGYMLKNNLNHPHCVSLNSLYAYEKSENNLPNSSDFAVTMAHELGHYLGLHHAFNEYPKEHCAADSDFCPDTPPYDREAYEAELMAILEEANGAPVSIMEVVKRDDCKTGQSFNSYNIMDYEISFADRLTNDQRKRIQHVLQYSPLRPTPRNALSKAATKAVEGELDLPIILKQ